MQIRSTFMQILKMWLEPDANLRTEMSENTFYSLDEKLIVNIVTHEAYLFMWHELISSISIML